MYELQRRNRASELRGDEPQEFGVGRIEAKPRVDADQKNAAKICVETGMKQRQNEQLSSGFGPDATRQLLRCRKIQYLVAPAAERLGDSPRIPVSAFDTLRQARHIETGDGNAAHTLWRICEVLDREWGVGIVATERIHEQMAHVREGLQPAGRFNGRIG